MLDKVRRLFHLQCAEREWWVMTLCGLFSVNFSVMANFLTIITSLDILKQGSEMDHQDVVWFHNLDMVVVVRLVACD